MADENRIHYARWEIESLLAQAQGIARPLQSDFEIEWSCDHSAVIVLPLKDEAMTTAPTPEADIVERLQRDTGSWSCESKPGALQDLHRAARDAAAEITRLRAAVLCGDCPPVGYSTDATRCRSCPRLPSSAQAPEGDAFAVLCRTYVQRADDRQRAMGLQYTEAETHDLAKVMERYARAAAEAQRAGVVAWCPWGTAPKDGQWFIALMNDRCGLMRVSWGRDLHGRLCWCSVDGSYGDGLFCGWLPWPAAAIERGEDRSAEGRKDG